MKYILIAFAFLAFVFYEASGGDEFVSRADEKRAALAAQEEAIRIAEAEEKAKRDAELAAQLASAPKEAAPADNDTARTAPTGPFTGLSRTCAGNCQATTAENVNAARGIARPAEPTCWRSEVGQLVRFHFVFIAQCICSINLSKRSFDFFDSTTLLHCFSVLYVSI